MAVAVLKGFPLKLTVIETLLGCSQVYVWHTRTENPKLLDVKGKVPISDWSVEV